MKCEFCNKEYSRRGIKYHIKYCKENPNKSELPAKSDLWWRKHRNKKNSNGFIKAKAEGREFKFSDETRKKISEASKSRKHSEETKKKISQLKKELYASGWECVAGRCPKYEYESHIAGNIKVDGSWELKFCQFADNENLTWKRNKKRFSYVKPCGKESTYQPDFYVEELNSYIEVKGYETDLDRCKWSQFSEKLLILRKSEIYNLKEWLEKQFIDSCTNAATERL